jgi:hypothetical protein
MPNAAQIVINANAWGGVADQGVAERTDHAKSLGPFVRFGTKGHPASRNKAAPDRQSDELMDSTVERE